MYCQAVGGGAPFSFLDVPYFWFLERKSQYSKTVGTGLLFNKFVTQKALVVQIVGLSERVLCRWENGIGMITCYGFLRGSSSFFVLYAKILGHIQYI